MKKKHTFYDISRILNITVKTGNLKIIFHYLFLTIFFANQFLRKIDGNHACKLFDSLIICGNFFHSCLTLHYYATNCSDGSGNQNLVLGLGVVMHGDELVKQAVLTVVASFNLKIYVIHF